MSCPPNCGCAPTRNDLIRHYDAPMTSLTRDTCPSCGAWLILVEVVYVAPAWRRYPEVGSRVVYECPSCAGVYETWATESDPLEEISRSRRWLRNELAARRRAPHA
jgi:hypothetical protein